MLLTNTFYFHLFLLLTFQTSSSLVFHSSSGHASHFLECVWNISFSFSIYLSLSLPTQIGYSVPPSYTLQPKGLTFPGSQHPPFFQLVLRRSKLLLTPVTASVSFCFVSSSCFLLLYLCLYQKSLFC